MAEKQSEKTMMMEIPLRYVKAVKMLLNFPNDGGFGAISFEFEDGRIQNNGIIVTHRHKSIKEELDF